MPPVIIAIDGPAGSGKSSVSKQVARETKFGYLDTGAAYRALTWACLNRPDFSLDGLHQMDLENHFEYSISLEPDNYWVKVANVDVTEAIRDAKVAESVSEVARIPEVRDFMKALTLKLVSDCEFSAVIVEGRDITTVVAPHAPVRILLTADETVRLKRRLAELSESTAASVLRQVTERDASDSKVVEFMTPAPGVQLVDTSDLNFSQSVSAVLTLIEQGLP